MAFLPNLTVGPQVCAAINRATTMFLDVHLMIYNPFDWIERFVEAGADASPSILKRRKMSTTHSILSAAAASRQDLPSVPRLRPRLP